MIAKKPIILLGYFQELVEILNENGINIFGVVDKNNKYLLTTKKYRYLGNDSDVISLASLYKKYKLVIAPDSPNVRKKLFSKYNNAGFSFQSLISSESYISSTAITGIGVVVHQLVKISSNSTIGKFCKLNSGCNITHDIEIGDFVTVAPNAVILGGVVIGNNSYIGANSTILPGITVGRDVVIGAGAVVTRNVDDNKVVVGNPARER